MKLVLVSFLGATAVQGLSHVRGSTEAESCSARDVTYRALVQSQLSTLAPTCETMCKRIGAYPNCDCPGFNGNPASSEDTRDCAGQYCKSGVDNCPTDAFTRCVKEKTKVAGLLQWQDLLSRLAKNTHSLAEIAAHSEKLSDAALADARDVTRRVFFQAKLNALSPVCENMCKKMNIYPNCQCPGFNGEPASSEDTRDCAGQYCKSGVDQCPTDAFVTCVKEKTKVAALLQWDELMEKYEHGTAVLAKLASQ